MIFAMIVFIIKHWKKLKPISDNLIELLVANIIIKKIKHKFVKTVVHKDFVIKVMLVLLLTLLGFLMQSIIGLPTYILAFSAAMLLGILCSKKYSAKNL